MKIAKIVSIALASIILVALIAGAVIYSANENQKKEAAYEKFPNYIRDIKYTGLLSGVEGKKSDISVLEIPDDVLKYCNEDIERYLYDAKKLGTKIKQFWQNEESTQNLIDQVELKSMNSITEKGLLAICEFENKYSCYLALKCHEIAYNDSQGIVIETYLDSNKLLHEINFAYSFAKSKPIVKDFYSGKEPSVKFTFETTKKEYTKSLKASDCFEEGYDMETYEGFLYPLSAKDTSMYNMTDFEYAATYYQCGMIDYIGYVVL